MPAFTLIVPYYRNPLMLARQVAEWNGYPLKGVKFIVVDDGSPEPARPIIEAGADEELRKRLQLYRITVDIPWNREGARNLGTLQADSDWMVHTDIDHVLPADLVPALLEFEAVNGRWYRFPRWRVGRADETRRKDAIGDDVEFGEIKPHIDSYLMEREKYWRAGGYDEDYVGCLGGGSEFLRRVVKLIGEPRLLPKPIALHVYTRHKIQDASDWSLSRDTAKGKEITRKKDATHGRGQSQPINAIRFPWIREL